MSEFAIEIKGLSVSYDKKRVLSNVFLKLPHGTLCGVVGPNGAGKSTLFKAILGLLEPTSGEVKIDGSRIKTKRKDMVYVPQKNEVDWSFPATVKDIVMMGRYPHKGLLGRMNNEDIRIVEEAMRETGIIDFSNRQIGALSGGQQQRVFLARALAQEAEIFLLDEPFVGVDMKTEEKIVAILKSLAAKGKTLLVVHHDLSTVINYFDHVLLLNQILVAAGPTMQTFTEKNIARTYGGQLTILHHSESPSPKRRRKNRTNS